MPRIHGDREPKEVFWLCVMLDISLSDLLTGALSDVHSRPPSCNRAQYTNSLRGEGLRSVCYAAFVLFAYAIRDAGSLAYWWRLLSPYYVTCLLGIVQYLVVYVMWDNLYIPITLAICSLAGIRIYKNLFVCK